MPRTILFLLLLVTLSAYAESGYRIVHPDGSVEFTDQPHEGAEEIELRQAPTIQFAPVKPAAPVPEKKSTPVAKKKAPVGDYTALTITTPTADETIWLSGEPVSVSVSLKPALAEGHAIRILLDGVPVTSGTSSTQQLSEVYRGSHTIGAEVVDSSGKVLISSPVTSFYLHRHSIQR